MQPLNRTLTSPRPSPLHPMERRGRIIRRLFVKPATGFAGRASAKPETCHRHSFSSREKARMRAVVKSLFLRRGATFYRQSPSQVTGRASQAAKHPSQVENRRRKPAARRRRSSAPRRNWPEGRRRSANARRKSKITVAGRKTGVAR